MSTYRLYDKVISRPWIYSSTTFIVAEVNWDYSHEFSSPDNRAYPDDWDELIALGFKDHHDAAIHCWLKKYHLTMFNWLNEHNIKWIGQQSGDSITTHYGSRGFTVVCVNLTDPDHKTEFMLAWG